MLNQPASPARPLLAGVNPRATFAALLAERLPVYRAVAVHEIATDDRTADEVAEAVHASVAGAPDTSAAGHRG